MAGSQVKVQARSAVMTGRHSVVSFEGAVNYGKA
jgi:hypothetical protein